MSRSGIQLWTAMFVMDPGSNLTNLQQKNTLIDSQMTNRWYKVRPQIEHTDKNKISVLPSNLYCTKRNHNQQVPKLNTAAS